MSTEQGLISEDILTEIVKKRFHGNIKIQSKETSQVVPVGENYLSDLQRMVIRFQLNGQKNIQSFSVIAKCPIENDTFSKTDKETDLYMRELKIYKDILPLFAKQATAVKLAPEMFYLSSESKRILVLEDLTRSNYKMANRSQGLNLEHCLLAIKKLAYFHASSMKIFENNPTIMEFYDNKTFKSSKFMDTIRAVLIQGTKNVCLKEPDLQKYANKINEHVGKALYETTKPDPVFSVLNHGDFWCNNMLFQYDKDDRVQDVVFVDYQLSMFTTPFYDLHYFLATSTTLEVKKNGIKDILNRYYDALSKNMVTLNVKKQIPTRACFEKMFSEKACLGLGITCFMLPLMKAKDTLNASLAEFVKNEGEGSFRQQCFSNIDYINALRCLLPFYEDLGLFDN